MTLIDLFKCVLKEEKDLNQLLYDIFSKMRIKLVLTAHPTETIRRTLIQKYHLIEECLGLLEMLSPADEDRYISERAQRTR
jgi:phosphoenolpyruvate carboxylase